MHAWPELAAMRDTDVEQPQEQQQGGQEQQQEPLTTPAPVAAGMEGSAPVQLESDSAVETSADEKTHDRNAHVRTHAHADAKHHQHESGTPDDQSARKSPEHEKGHHDKRKKSRHHKHDHGWL